MIDLLKDYIEKRFQLIKLELVGVIANIASGLVNSFLILVFLLFILLMLSISLAFWLAEIMNNIALGFLTVGGIYILIFIIYFLFGKEAIGNKVKDSIVANSLNSDKE